METPSGVALSLWAHILVPLSLGTLVARITKEEVRTWYSRLRKPAWTPPPPVFGIVWPLLYVLMGTASWMLFRSPASHLRTVALGFYIAGLLGNLSYQIIFMKAHALKTSCASVAMQLVFTVGCALASLAIQPLVATILAPLIAWQLFALYLAVAIAVKNADQPAAEAKEEKTLSPRGDTGTASHLREAVGTPVQKKKE